jgi:hypothetical protein
MEQPSGGQKRKERVEDDFDHQLYSVIDYSVIDPRLFDGELASDIPPLATVTPPSATVPAEASQVTIPGLCQLKNISSNDLETHPTKRIKTTVPPSSKPRSSIHQAPPKRKLYSGTPSEYLEAKRQSASWQLVNEGLTPPPPPRPMVPHTETYFEPTLPMSQYSDLYLPLPIEFPENHDLRYHELSPDIKDLLSSYEIKKMVDDFQAQQKRNKEKEKERRERSLDIIKYQNVMASLERKFTFERCMKNVGAQKKFARPGITPKRIAKGKKLKEGLVKRGKSSGLRTCWILGLCTPAEQDTSEEDQFEEGLEDELNEKLNGSGCEVEKSYKGRKYWGLRKRMARDKESLFGTGWE